MPSTPSTPSRAPAPSPPPPDERMPLSSVPDLTKFFPPLIQDAICAEMSRGEEGVYYDEFEQLYWMYSGWDEVREDFERVWRPILDEVQDYLDLRFAARGGGNVELRAELARVEADLLPRATQVCLQRQGPAGLAILRQRHRSAPCARTVETANCVAKLAKSTRYLGAWSAEGGEVGAKRRRRFGSFHTVARHGKDASSHYGLDSSSVPSKPWSSRPLLLDSLYWHFEVTGGARFGRGADMSEKQAVQAELKTQMAGVAEYVFSAFEERLLYLETVNGDAPAPELRQLRERYLEVAAAPERGERHRDFDSLVHLSNDPTHGSPSRIRSYLDQYRQNFAFPLYRFYLDQGKLRTLLEPDEAHRSLLTAFLDSTDNNKLGWINDVAIDRFDHGSLALSTEAAEEPSAPTKKLMLSLSKLAQVAQLDRQTLEGEEVQRALEVVDDNLDLVNTQQNLSTFFTYLLSGTEMRLPPTEQGEVVAGRLAPALADRTALSQQVASLCARVLGDESVSAEDLIDILSLKENNAGGFADFGGSKDAGGGGGA
ncbi:Non-repetitive/WGA-negative nucleoporin C-terminal-domain containing protein [Rhodotorula toruloides]|uniref:Non-repetitive/WGA-negative nucleoporin C-terminal-domain containing protein n=1 Tax=Rhodotorula toruloides TaxID=5286 RepID=A0A2T0A6T7_RHOTO|nr:Non-repetitive/WGA-negative nucleoporin C-terminal-domain containing protein [Rhodotorula toruloides]PRQ73723.1 Non-repetitive/WGA-negative nucleoporin C-terminal-domain containing protein [Rhodotorula toruloides]